MVIAGVLVLAVSAPRGVIAHLSARAPRAEFGKIPIAAALRAVSTELTHAFVEGYFEGRLVAISKRTPGHMVDAADEASIKLDLDGRVRSELNNIINRVDWSKNPATDAKSLWYFDTPSAEGDIVWTGEHGRRGRKFLLALSLVCAAWDAHLGRKERLYQWRPAWYLWSQPERTVRLKHDWPWVKVGDSSLALQPITIAPDFHEGTSGTYSVRGFINTWNSLKRPEPNPWKEWL